MTLYIVKCPDGQWLARDGQVLLFIDMASAQAEIVAREPDVLAQARWQIHPIEPGASDVAGVKVQVSWKLDKYDLDGNLIETRTGEYQWL